MAPPKKRPGAYHNQKGYAFGAVIFEVDAADRTEDRWETASF